MTGGGIGRLGATLAVFVLALPGCGPETGRPAAAPPTTPQATGANVIDFHGLPGIAIGASLGELTTSGAITTTGPGCGPAFVAVQDASPAFDADKLVLIWAYPPLHTPEHVGVGSSIEDVRAAYPSSVNLSAPDGSRLYPGLLVAGPDDLAYLMLYDGGEVQKLIVGQQKYARMLLDTGFGSC